MSKNNKFSDLNKERCEEYLDAAVWALDILNQELLEKNIVNSEKYKIHITGNEAKLSENVQERAKQLEQFYTVPQLAKEIFTKFQEHCTAFAEDNGAWYLEPSAGRGDIYNMLPEGRRRGVDLEPKHEEIIKMKDPAEKPYRLAL